MKRLAPILCFAVINAPESDAVAIEASSITVNVSSFRNTDGLLRCALYSGAETFLDTGPRAAALERVTVAGKSAACRFSSVGPGNYAVAVLHDENRNGKMDTNLVGMPIEGYGVSNDKTHALSAPTWEESRFVVEAGKPRTISITLRY